MEGREGEENGIGDKKDERNGLSRSRKKRARNREKMNKRKMYWGKK